MVVSWRSLSRDAESGVVTVATVGRPTEPASRDERTEEPGCRAVGCAGNGAISSMSIGARLSEARGTSFATK